MDPEVSPVAPTITVTWADVMEGRAYIRLPFVSKLLLAHWAGAPWSNKDPDANLHALQVEVLAHREREKLVHGASRLGKSVLGGVEAIEELMYPGAKLAVIAQRYDHVGAEWQYVHGGMGRLFPPQAFKRRVFKHQAMYHDYDVETIWGSRGRGYSVDSDEGAALLGQEFTRLIYGEGSHISQDIHEKRALRAVDSALMRRRGGYRQRETGKISIYTTPKEYSGCSAAEWERVMKQTGRQPERLHYDAAPYPETVWMREADILENPHYDRAVYEARKASLSRAAFEEQYQGRMTFRTGRVLHHFDEDRHLIRRPTPDEIRAMNLGVGIDTGAYTALVLGGIAPDGRKFALGETYTRQQTLQDTLADFRVMMLETLGPVFRTDRFDDLLPHVDSWVIDPASQHKLEFMAEIDVALSTPLSLEGGKLELLPSLEVVNNWFATDDLFISEDLEDLQGQLRRYVWKTVRAGLRGSARAPAIKEPRKEEDHIIDAMRFLMFYLQLLGPREAAPNAPDFQTAWKNAQRDRITGPLRDVLAQARSRPGGIPV